MKRWVVAPALAVVALLWQNSRSILSWIAAATVSHPVAAVTVINVILVACLAGAVMLVCQCLFNEGDGTSSTTLFSGGPQLFSTPPPEPGAVGLYNLGNSVSVVSQLYG